MQEGSLESSRESRNDTRVGGKVPHAEKCRCEGKLKLDSKFQLYIVYIQCIGLFLNKNGIIQLFQKPF